MTYLSLAARTSKRLTSLWLLLMLAGSLFPQANTGRILGRVTDQTGGALPGAVLTIVDTQRGISRSVIADNTGEFNVPNLTPGAYALRAQMPGFKTAENSAITLDVAQDLRVDLQLQPGDQVEKVNVTAEAPLTDTTGADLGGTIENALINDLPLNGRNFENLETLRPGVTIYPGGGSWTTSTDGIRAHDQVFLVDGVNSNDPYLGMAVMNAALLAGDARTLLPVDSIEEFRTEENP